MSNPRQTTKQMSERVAQQVRKAYREKNFGSDFVPSLGYAKQLRDSFEACGRAFPDDAARAFAAEAEACIRDAAGLGTAQYQTPEAFIGYVDALLDALVNKHMNSGE